MAPGRTYGEQHFSPLNKIDAGNVKQLGLAWFYDLDTAHRGQESTPLVIDGVMYVTSAWSKVFALDAKTGAPLWTYDPKVPGQVGVNACCDVVNRGVAAWKGEVYVGTLDGRLIALDAATGKPVWEATTVPAGGALHHHRRAARREGHGADRQRRRAKWACAATSRPTTPTPAGRSGASTPCPAIPRNAVRERRARKGRQNLERRRGGSWAAAARCGTRWSTTRRWI